MKLDAAAPKGAYVIMDAARALAAALVAVSHIRDLLLTDYASGQNLAMRAFYFGTGFGHAGVIIFFVLSGFWISKTTVRRTNTPGGFWADYLIDRLARLGVVLVPALLLGGLLDICGIYIFGLPIYRGGTGAQSISAQTGQHLSPEALAVNLLFLQSLVGPTFGSNGSLWSLAYEFWYYLWFPALWLALRWRNPGIGLGVLMLGPFFPLLAFGFLCWLCGGMLLLLVNRAERLGIARIKAMAVLILGSVAFAAAMVGIRIYPIWWMDLPLSLGFSSFLLGLSLVEVPAPRWLLPITRYGAASSFSLYAIHYPIAALASGLLTRGGRLPPTLASVTLVVALLLVVVVAGLVFSRATEARTAAVRRFLHRHLSVAHPLL